MGYEKELKFAEKLLYNFRISLRYLTEKNTENFAVIDDLGLRDILNYNYDETSLLKTLEKHCKSNTIYRVKNVLMCQYLLFKLPDTEKPVFVYIGPYTFAPVSKQDILKLAEQYHVTPGNLTQLEQFYQDLPILSDENILSALMYTLGEYLWGDADHFTVRDDFQFPTYVQESIVPLPDVQTPEDALLSVQIMEKLYETEQHLLQAVTNGQLHKAELYLSNLASRQYEARTNNPVRDLRNYAIILNTLLRKAVENAAVHPIHIHAISSQYARKIETLTSHATYVSLTKEMVRKYCLLVKNHSLKGYSLLVRKVITGIDSDLTADLSLNAQARILNVNPSYLSTLFKKETGSTLTEYVNRKRIEHALLLLNTTDMQIQMIAQYCGITDVNYFTKTFKKIVGKTPKEYREMITSQF